MPDHSGDQIVEIIANSIKNSERILIGGGAGLSASAGIDYTDSVRVNRSYQNYANTAHLEIPDEIGSKSVSINNDAGSFIDIHLEKIGMIGNSNKQFISIHIIMRTLLNVINTLRGRHGSGPSGA